MKKMKKMFAIALAVATMSTATVSFATEPIDWSDNEKGVVNGWYASVYSDSLSTVDWKSGGKQYGTLASNFAWSRLCEFGTANMTKLQNKTVKFYDVDNETIKEAQRMYAVVGNNDDKVWYGGGARVQLSDKEIKPGGKYRVTVKAGAEIGEALLNQGAHLYASFMSPITESDMRYKVGVLANYDNRVENGSVADLGEVLIDKKTVDSESYYQLKEYTADIIADPSVFSVSGVYSGLTTLNLYVAIPDGNGSWSQVVPKSKTANLHFDSIKIEQVDAPETATRLVRRGIRQTFEKYTSQDATSVSSDKMGWDGIAVDGVTRYGTQKNDSNIKLGNKLRIDPRYSDHALLLVNIEGKAEELAVSRDYTKDELRPGEKYCMTFNARVNQKALSCPVTVTVGGTDIAASTSDVIKKNNGNAIYGWKQLCYIFTAPEESAYTDGKINVQIKFGNTAYSKEVRAYIDNVTMTAENQSFAADFEAGDYTSFYTNVYAGTKEKLDSTIYCASFKENKFVDLDTIRYMKGAANTVAYTSETVDLSTGIDTIKTTYWNDMYPLTNAVEIKK